MSRITLADLTAEPTTVELFGTEYTVQTFTRAVSAKFDAAQKALEETDDEDNDKKVAALADVVASLLEGTPPAKKAITDAWKRDDLDLGQIRALYESVQEAAFARPTSRRPS